MIDTEKIIEEETTRILTEIALDRQRIAKLEDLILEQQKQFETILKLTEEIKANRREIQLLREEYTQLRGKTYQLAEILYQHIRENGKKAYTTREIKEMLGLEWYRQARRVMMYVARHDDIILEKRGRTYRLRQS